MPHNINKDPVVVYIYTPVELYLLRKKKEGAGEKKEAKRWWEREITEPKIMWKREAFWGAAFFPTHSLSPSSFPAYVEVG